MFNNGILLKGVLITKLLNNPFASCSFTNLDFLLLHIKHYGDSITLPLNIMMIVLLYRF